MAAKSVSHTVSLSIGNVALSLTDTTTATANPTDYVLGSQTVTTAYEAIAAGEVDPASCLVMLLLKNENTTGTSELQVSLDNESSISLVLHNGQTNLISVENFGNVKIKSNTGSIDVSYMAIQIGANT
tara:strand:- start:453 stop:836 length:384 start_codon:yes stop_codon:yes gene_type:complete